MRKFILIFILFIFFISCVDGATKIGLDRLNWSQQLPGTIGPNVDATAINSALHSNKDVEIIGPCTITSAIVPVNGNNIIINGTIAVSGECNGFTVVEDNIKIVGGTIDCTSQTGYYSDGIHIQSDNIVIDGVNIIKSKRHGIIAFMCSNVDVYNCDVYNSSNYGIFFDRVSISANIVNNNVSKSYSNAIDIYPVNNSKYIISENLVDEVYAGNGIAVASSTDTITASTIISNNIVSNTCKEGIITIYTNGTTITDNSVFWTDSSSTDLGITTDRSMFTVIVGNTVMRSSIAGINLDAAQFCAVTGNVVYNCGTVGSVVDTYDTHGILIQDGYGISRGNYVGGNNVYSELGNELYGIREFSWHGYGCTYNTVGPNNVYGWTSAAQVVTGDGSINNTGAWFK